MRKDLEIPEVEDVFMAAVKEFNNEFRTEDWNVYLINNSEERIMETVLIVSKGADQNRKTSVMRHKIEKLPPKSFAKIEFLQEEVLELQNEFWLSFFHNSRMFDKKFTFPPKSIGKSNLKEIPVIPEKGVLAE